MASSSRYITGLGSSIFGLNYLVSSTESENKNKNERRTYFEKNLTNFSSSSLLGQRRFVKCEVESSTTNPNGSKVHYNPDGSKRLSRDQLWRLKDPATRTNKDYFIATHKDWSRQWDEDWDDRHPTADKSPEEIKKIIRRGAKKKRSKDDQASGGSTGSSATTNGGTGGSTDSTTGNTTTNGGNSQVISDQAMIIKNSSNNKPDVVKKQEEQRVNTVRHIFMIRHGQYNLDDDIQGLTEMGKHQSKKTGQRLKAYADGLKKDHYGEIKIQWKRLICSNMQRAKETANIIGEQLSMEVKEYDPLLNEGNPCIMHPSPGVDLDTAKLAKFGTDPPRIESAFRKYIHRSENWKKHKKESVTEIFTGERGEREKEDSVSENGTVETVHEYEIIVCHMNIIRYFVCRALQIPPEAWLRFRGDNCGITEIIVYDDGRVSLGRFADQGHLTIEETTFH